MAPPPSHPLCLIPLTLPTAIPLPTPRARAAALDRVASPPRGVGPALPGRRIAPASAAFLSFSARPSPPPAPLQARGGVALPVEDRGDPAATATGLPPVSSCLSTPLAEAAPAPLSPPPTTDPKPPLGPSGLGLPARRRARYRIAATPLPQLLLPGTPTSLAGRFRIPQGGEAKSARASVPCHGLMSTSRTTCVRCVGTVCLWPKPMGCTKPPPGMLGAAGAPPAMSPAMER